MKKAVVEYRDNSSFTDEKVSKRLEELQVQFAQFFVEKSGNKGFSNAAKKVIVVLSEIVDIAELAKERKIAEDKFKKAKVDEKELIQLKSQ